MYFNNIQAVIPASGKASFVCAAPVKGYYWFVFQSTGTSYKFNYNANLNQCVGEYGGINCDIRMSKNLKYLLLAMLKINPSNTSMVFDSSAKGQWFYLDTFTNETRMWLFTLTYSTGVNVYGRYDAQPHPNSMDILLIMTEMSRLFAVTRILKSRRIFTFSSI